MTSGGNVAIGVPSFIEGGDPQAAPDVVVKPGAVIDISGGWVRYEAGRVQTSRLVTAEGAVVGIGAADPNARYVGIVSGFTEVQERWGVVESFANQVLTGDHFQDSYTEGPEAGDRMRGV